MKRRTIIRNAIIFSAGAALLPSCWQSDNKPLSSYKNLALTGDEEMMLSNLSETILPKTNFIGAADVKAHEFTLMMVDDCYPPDEQKVFMDGMKQFEKLAEKKLGKSFVKSTTVQKKELLAAIESKKDISEEVQQFYGIAKRHTLQAFTSSRQYMTDVLQFKLVPGSNFKGCVPVKKD